MITSKTLIKDLTDEFKTKIDNEAVDRFILSYIQPKMDFLNPRFECEYTDFVAAKKRIPELDSLSPEALAWILTHQRGIDVELIPEDNKILVSIWIDMMSKQLGESKEEQNAF